MREDCLHKLSKSLRSELDAKIRQESFVSMIDVGIKGFRGFMRR